MQGSNRNLANSDYASIMVAVDLGLAAVARVGLASRLADRFSSHLIGVAAKQFLRRSILRRASGPGRVSWNWRRSVRKKNLPRLKSSFATLRDRATASNGAKRSDHLLSFFASRRGPLIW